MIPTTFRHDPDPPVRVLLRCSGCGLRWTAATLEPAPCPVCGRRKGIATVRRFNIGTPRPGGASSSKTPGINQVEVSST